MKGFLRLRGNTYYFRCRIPHDLSGTYFHGKEILKSLHTRDKKLAQDAAAEWYCRTAKVFHLCRFNSLPESQLQALVQAELFPVKGKQLLSTSPLLRDLFDSYISDHKVNWREKSYDEVTYSLELAVNVIGNVPTSVLSAQTIKTYLDTLLQLPPNHTKSPRYRNMNIGDILKTEGITPMSRKSVCKHMQWLGAALKHVKLEYLLDGMVLPTVTRKPHEERSPYDLTELQKILDNLTWSKLHPDRLWVPLIGILQGMRLNEICQLHVDDIAMGDVPSISINDVAEKQVKNDDSFRVIPIHPKLLKLGFLDYVRKVKDSGETRLFWTLKPHRGAYSHYTGKWFQTFNRKHVTSDLKKVFHSFRHGLIDYLANSSEAKEHQIAWLVGHTNRKSETTGRYAKPPSPGQLLPIIEMYELWKSLKWDMIEIEIQKSMV